MIQNKTAIIAGKGNLPITIANSCYSKNGEQLVIVGIDNYANESDYKDHIFQHFAIGQVGAILKFLKNNQVDKLIICGSITRPDFGKIKVDAKGAILLSKIIAAKFLGDDNLLKIVAKFLEDEGLKILSPIDFMNSDLVKTDITPSKRDNEDIEIGLNVAKIIGNFDIGQSVIVENGHILGVEGPEGTDNLIKRCKELKNTQQNSGILVKIMKPNQDPRLDTPLIGSDTVQLIHDAGMKGIAISGVILLDGPNTIALANKLKIFIKEIR